MLQTNYDVSKIFIRDNRYLYADYTNGSGQPVELKAGTVFGRISASNKVTPHTTVASDGSQIPRFVLKENYTVAAGATARLCLCCGGDVDASMLVLNGSDTLATVISGVGTIGDTLRGLGNINAVESTELTGYNNQPN